jgi:hypothetical protein
MRMISISAHVRSSGPARTEWGRAKIERRVAMLPTTSSSPSGAERLGSSKVVKTRAFAWARLSRLMDELAIPLTSTKSTQAAYSKPKAVAVRSFWLQISLPVIQSSA